MLWGQKGYYNNTDNCPEMRQHSEVKTEKNHPTSPYMYLKKEVKNSGDNWQQTGCVCSGCVGRDDAFLTEQLLKSSELLLGWSDQSWDIWLRITILYHHHHQYQCNIQHRLISQHSNTVSNGSCKWGREHVPHSKVLPLNAPFTNEIFVSITGYLEW